MPTYEYRCAAGHTFEKFQRMSEPPLDSCPTCGASAERLLSAGIGLLFKGSGFYITDYRSDAYRKAAAAEGGGATESGKSATSGEKGDASDGGRTTTGGADKSADKATGGTGESTDAKKGSAGGGDGAAGT